MFELFRSGELYEAVRELKRSVLVDNRTPTY
jgi:hypothetical protein